MTPPESRSRIGTPQGPDPRPRAWDLLVTGAHLCTMAPGAGVVEPGAVAAAGGVVVYAGPEADLPAGDAVTRIDAGGRLVTPGLVDCHTHLVFAGDRAGEMEQRLAGASYEQIAAAGGGIASTVRATRAASDDELLALAAGRLRHLVRSGVTTVEVKSGYGLDTATELRLLGVARRLGPECGVTVRSTFLGAHTVPPEFAGRADEYVDLVVGEMLPAVAGAGLADAVDAFCEPSVGFAPDQVRRVVDAARRHGLPVKLHADQLSDSGGASLAAGAGALSADHLEHTSDAGVAALAQSATVAVLLPGAAHVLGETAVPPVAALRVANVPMAVATDANPGTSPVLSLPLAMHLACVHFGLTPAEALAGATVQGARALGLADAGALVPGRRADFVLWDAARPAELVYWLGATLAATVVAGGRVV